MKKSRRQSLKQKLTVALSLVNALNMAAPVALPYVNVAKNVRADGGQAERLSDFLARSLYGTAQATIYNVPPNSTVDTMNGGDYMVVEDGGTGTVTTMKNGNQTVRSGGTGTIATMNDGFQYVSNGGKGTVVTMGGGTQNVSNGGVGTVTTMGGGTQKAFGGTGTVETMSGGTQYINSSGKGTVVTMRGGEQIADNGCNGTVTTMSGGTQYIRRGGTGTVETMSGGTQLLNFFGGTSIVVTMSGGEQIVSSYEDGGTVYIGTGTISTMSGGTQTVSSGSLGTVTTMSGGEQIVSNGGTGTVAAMNGGVQQVENGGTSLNTHVNSGGVQNVAGTATGTIVKGGTQNVKNGGTSKDTTISAGAQNVEAGASADGAILKGGTQNVKTGATVANTTVSAGTQNVENGGTANNTTVNSGGVQAVKNGGVVSGGTVAKGAALVVENGAEVKDTTVEGGWVESPDGDINGGTLKGGEYTVVSGVSVERMILEGGTQFVEAGGRTTSTTIEKNGTQILQAGTENNTGGVSEHITLNGGTLEVGDYAWAQIDKAEGGTLRLLDLGLAEAQFGDVNTAAGTVYNLTNLYARGDTVTLGMSDGNGSSAPGKILNIAAMDGYANFVVNTDLANNVSDEIHIGNAANATQANTVKINYDPTLAAGQTVTTTNTKVATVANGTAIFEGAKSTIGGVDYLPTVETTDGGKSWYITGFGKKGASDGSHHTLMGMTAGMAALAAGTAFIDDATAGLGLSANTGKDGVSTFAKLGGGTMRQETGSHVNVNTWNAILALGHANKKERGTFEYGAFFEYGSGNYTTHENDLRGDGSMRYTGGGVLAKWTANHGFYVEGSLRAGTVHDDASNVLHDDVNTYSYDTNAGYFGAHIGVGKEIEVVGGNTVDVYGKFFYNRRNGVTFETGGNAYDLDAVRSEILRVGARYTMKREKWNFYGGVAYEHEFGGEATGTVDGLAIRSADIKGGSARFELGATMKPDKNGTWSLDLNVAGFAGKKQGVSGGVSVAFMF